MVPPPLVGAFQLTVRPLDELVIEVITGADGFAGEITNSIGPYCVAALYLVGFVLSPPLVELLVPF